MSRTGNLVNPPAAVLFDWDSTLVDNWGAIRDSINHVFAGRGMPQWSRERVMEEAKLSARDRFPSLFGPDWEQARQQFLDRFESRHLETLRPLDGARTLLNALKLRNIPLAVVSNKHGAALRREVEYLGWRPFFQRVVGAADTVRDKPAPEPIFLALQETGVEPGPTVWFIGDSEVDMVSAHQAGCVPVLVRDVPPAPGEFDATPVACYVNSRWELVSIVEHATLGG